MNIQIEVSIPCDYTTTIKNPHRLMTVYGWLPMDAVRPNRSIPGAGAHYLERCDVIDANDQDPLPRDLFVAVYGLIGHGFTSWGAHKAFVSKERAEEHIARSAAPDCPHWLVSASRI